MIWLRQVQKESRPQTEKVFEGVIGPRRSAIFSLEETGSPRREILLRGCITVTKKRGFASMAQNTAKLAGSSSAFVAICLITMVWLVTGPIFHWSDTWQLVINTVTNIVSMLMVFVIQNTQNRESSALQLKIDELLRAVRGAHNTFINLEELSEEDLDDLKDKSAALAKRARLKAGQAFRGRSFGDCLGHRHRHAS